MNLTAILPFVQPDAPGCPQMVALHHIRQAAIRFCEDSLVWVTWLTVASASVAGAGDPLLTEAGEQITDTDGIAITMAADGPSSSTSSTGYANSYLLPLPAQSAMVKLLRFRVDGEPAETVDPDQGDDLRASNSRMNVAWSNDLKNVEVSPSPEKEGVQYELRVALKPNQVAVEIPDFIGEHYAAAISYGARATILAMKDQPWSKPGEAAEFEDKFTEASSNAASRAARGYGRATKRVASFNY